MALTATLGQHSNTFVRENNLFSCESSRYTGVAKRLKVASDPQISSM